MESHKTSPLYIQLSKTLKEKIVNNYYKVGDLLPTEESLQKIYSASRTTVRKAVEVLEDEGFVKKYQGFGTKICSVHPKQDLNHLSSITETLSKMYGSVQTGNLVITKTKPSAEIQGNLIIGEHEDIYILQRTRIVQDKTIAFIKNFLVAKFVPDLEKYREMIAINGLYRTIETVYKLELDNAVENISVYMSGPLEAEIFEIQSQIPLYCSKRKTYLTDGSLFESVTSFIRAEDFEYTVYLKGRPKKTESAEDIQ